MSVLSEIGWQGVVDIAALTVLAFSIYLWLRGTVALQVLGGLALILAASVVVDRVGLVMTGHVLQGVGAVGAVLVVVLFREEIRNGLRRADPVQWARKRWRRESGESLRYLEIARAVSRLAEQQIGALLVLPRHDSVDELVSGGTEVDAVASAQLVEAVFHTHSPLHDGAAIISGDRLRIAGTVLPLSTSAELPAGLGTRHRAAVGLSEECDALVVVVSEERGDVSLVSDGELAAAPRDPEALARELGRMPGQPSGHPSRRRWRLRDAVALLVILLAVTGTWSMVMGARRVVVTTTTPIEMRDLPDAYRAAIVRPGSGTARLRVRGPRWLLDDDQLSEVRAWIDLDSPELGRQRLRLRVDAPPGLEVVDREPVNVAVRVRKQKKE